jgi:hypothetical protein
MDKEALVREFRQVLLHLEKEVGPVALLMLLGQDPVGSSWTAIVSAAKLDPRPRSESLKFFIRILGLTVKGERLHTISRASVMRSDDPFVRAINSAFAVENSDVQLQSCNINGLDIANAIIFQSKRIPAAAMAAGG